MATSTTNYSFTLPEVGGDTDQWGSQLNANWTLADSTLKTIEDSVVNVTLTGNDYLTISGQSITVGDVDLSADVTGTLPVGSGGTGLAALGSANQVLGVNSVGTALEYKTLSTGGTVTSVTVTGSDGIEIDSGSPVTTSGTIALGINATSLSTHLGLGSLATQSSVTESQISDLGSYITASSTDTLTNKSGDISQWTNDSGYLTAEDNDLSAAVTWVDVPDVNITESSVTQHEAALTITESQISDFGSYQTSDAGLTSIAGLTTAADKMIYTTAADTYAVADLTSAGRALLDDADAAAQRTTLGLGTAATSDASAFEAAGSVSTHAALTEVHGISAFGATLVDDADAAAARTTLGLGTAATTAATNYATSAQGTTADSALQDLVSDTTPQLGGNLDVNGNSIVSASAGNISITPDTTGKIILDGLSWPTADGTTDQVLKTDGAGNLSFVNQSALVVGTANYIEHSSTVSDSLAISAGTNRMYIANTTFSGSGTMGGYLVISHGYANFTGASALNVTGTLNVVG